MNGDEPIELMLTRTSHLRLKINKAIHASSNKEIGAEHKHEESLFGIRETLESLHKHLASFQALQQRQRYEREAALTDIDHSRKALFIKLGEYKGDDLEVIREAAAFASETVEQDDVFFFPQHPSQIPDSFAVNDNIPSSYFDSKNNPSKNGLLDSAPNNIMANESYTERTTQSAGQNKQKWMTSVLGLIAKSAIFFVGIVSVLSLAGFKPEIRKRDTSINLLDVLPYTAGEAREVSIHCPPGKILVVENGKARCLVKERVEIPFGSDFENSNINIAFG